MSLHGKIVVIKRSGGDGTEFPLTASCLFGRKPDCDIRIQLPHVSKEHCRIELNENKEVILTNLSSTNPTRVNGEVFQQSERLKHGDLITIIDRSFRFEYPPAPTPKKNRYSTTSKSETPQVLHETQARDTSAKDGTNTSDVKPKEDGSLEQNKPSSPFCELYQMFKQDLDSKTPKKALGTPASKLCPQKPISTRKVDGASVISTPKKAETENVSPVTGVTPKSAQKKRKSLKGRVVEGNVPVEDFIQLPPSILETPKGKRRSSKSITPTIVEEKSAPVSQRKSHLATPEKFTASEVAEQISECPTAEILTTPTRRRSREATPIKSLITGVEPPADAFVSNQDQIVLTENSTPSTLKTEHSRSPRPAGGKLQAQDVLCELEVTTPINVKQSSAKKRKSGDLETEFPTPLCKRKRVSFGGHLEPELFDKRLPPDSPLCKGATPGRRSLCAPKMKRSLLRRASAIGLIKEHEQSAPESLSVKGSPGKKASPKKSPKASPKTPSPAKSPKASAKTPSPAKSPKASAKTPSPAKSPKASAKTPSPAKSPKASAKTPSPAKSPKASAKTPSPAKSPKASAKTPSPAKSPKASAKTPSPAKSPKASAKTPSPAKSPKASAKTPSPAKSPKASAKTPSPAKSPKASAKTPSPAKSPKASAKTPSPAKSPKASAKTPSPAKSPKASAKTPSPAKSPKASAKTPSPAKSPKASAKTPSPAKSPKASAKTPSPAKSPKASAKTPSPAKSPKASAKTPSPAKTPKASAKTPSPAKTPKASAKTPSSAKKSTKAKTPSPGKEKTPKTAVKTPSPARRKSTLKDESQTPKAGKTPKTPASLPSANTTPTIQGRFSVSLVSTPSPTADQDSVLQPSVTVTPRVPLRRTTMSSTSKTTQKSAMKNSLQVIRRRSGVSRASMKVVNSWADIVKFGQTKTQAVIPTKKTTRVTKTKTVVPKPKTPVRKLLGHVSTGHADSPVTIVVGKAHRLKAIQPSGAAPKLVHNIAVLKKNMRMDEDLSALELKPGCSEFAIDCQGIADIFKTPARQRKSVNVQSALKTPLRAQSTSMIESSVMNTPEETGEMVVSPLVVSTAKRGAYNSDAVTRLLRDGQESSFITEEADDCRTTQNEILALERSSEELEEEQRPESKKSISTPKQKKPEQPECLTGVKRIMKTPRQKVQPIEDLRGKLMTTPKQKLEQLECLTGVKRIMKTPRQKVQPIEDLRGKLMTTPRGPKASQEVSLVGVKELLTTPKQIAETVEEMSGKVQDDNVHSETKEIHGDAVSPKCLSGNVEFKMPLYGKIVVIKRSGGDGTAFPLTASCLFGRKPDCDICVKLPEVSKEHCRIELNENNEVILTNLSSTNPTRVNGEVLQHSEHLKHGDLITIIDRSFRFEYPQAPTPKRNRSSKQNTPRGPKALQKVSLDVVKTPEHVAPPVEEVSGDAQEIPDAMTTEAVEELAAALAEAVEEVETVSAPAEAVEEEQPAPLAEAVQEVEEPASVPAEAVQEVEEPASVPAEAVQEVEEPASVPAEAVQEVEEPASVPAEAVDEEQPAPLAEPVAAPAEAVEEKQPAPLTEAVQEVEEPASAPAEAVDEKQPAPLAEPVAAPAEVVEEDQPAPLVEPVAAPAEVVEEDQPAPLVEPVAAPAEAVEEDQPAPLVEPVAAPAEAVEMAHYDSEEPSVPVKGRGKKTEGIVPPPARGRSARRNETSSVEALAETMDSVDVHEKMVADPVPAERLKRGRKAKQASVERVESVQENAVESESAEIPPIEDQQPTSDVPVEKPRRGRKAKQASVEQVETVLENTEAVSIPVTETFEAQTPVVRSERGRKPKPDSVEEVEAGVLEIPPIKIVEAKEMPASVPVEKPQARGKRGKQESEEAKTMEENVVAVDIPTEEVEASVLFATPKRGRKTKQEPVDQVESVSVETPIEQVVAQEQATVAPVEKPKRGGRKTKQASVEQIEDHPVESLTVELQEQTTVAPVEKPKRGGRKTKQASVEKVEPVEEHPVASLTVEVEAQEQTTVAPVEKPKRGGRKTKQASVEQVEDHPVESLTVELQEQTTVAPVEKPKRGGRKTKQASVEPVVDHPVETLTVELQEQTTMDSVEKPKRVGRRTKQDPECVVPPVSTKTQEETSAPPTEKPKRGGRRAKQQKVPEVVEVENMVVQEVHLPTQTEVDARPEREEADAEELLEAPVVKPGWRRKAKAIVKDEVPAKRARRGAADSTKVPTVAEATVEVPTEPVKRGRRAAKSKVSADETTIAAESTPLEAEVTDTEVMTAVVRRGKAPKKGNAVSETKSDQANSIEGMETIDEDSKKTSKSVNWKPDLEVTHKVTPLPKQKTSRRNDTVPVTKVEEQPERSEEQQVVKTVRGRRARSYVAVKETVQSTPSKRARHSTIETSAAEATVPISKPVNGRNAARSMTTEEADLSDKAVPKEPVKKTRRAAKSTAAASVEATSTTPAVPEGETIPDATVVAATRGRGKATKGKTISQEIDIEQGTESEQPCKPRRGRAARK